MVDWMKTTASIRIFLFLSALRFIPAVRADVSLNGIVQDSKTLRPISGAQVTVAGAAARSPEQTDNDGKFFLLLADTSPGDRVRLRADKVGYRTSDTWVIASNNNLLTIKLVPIRLATTNSSGGPEYPRNSRTPALDMPQNPPPIVDESPYRIGVGSISADIQGSTAVGVPVVLCGAPIVSARVEKSRILVSTTLEAPGQPMPVKVVDNRLIDYPPGWDWNIDAGAFEVVDSHQQPKLQVVYLTAKTVVVYGSFVSGTCTGIVDANGSLHTQVADFGQFPLARIFLYPSKLHEGQRDVASRTEPHQNRFAHTPNRELGAILIQDSAKLEAVAKECMTRLEASSMENRSTANARANEIRAEFNNRFEACCLPEIRTAHAEAVFRLKEAGSNPGERMWSTVDQNHPGDCGYVLEYAPHLSQLGEAIGSLPN
jgi:hypothetical protein